MKTRKVDVEITEPDGTVIFHKEQVEIPEQWSDRAATIAASKYFSHDEDSVLTLVGRIVRQIMLWGQEQEYFKDENQAYEFMHSLEEILLDQRAAFNSPVWFNVGVKENDNQTAACFIYGVEDNMEDILEHSKREGLTFKSGSGAGVNVSKLRAQGEQLSNRGVASGPLSFMRIWDQTAGSIKSGGKTRRSAKMVMMDVDHPDIEAFIDCKLLEEKKAKILIDNGVPVEEALATVSFQNANHSIMITDEFMEAVVDDKDWNLILRGLGSVSKIVKARELFRKIAEVAWATGDPGIQFRDRINLDNPVPSMGDIECSNPCFTGDMRLLTSTGYRRFDEIEGSELNIINKEGSVTQSKIWCSGVKPIYEVKFHWRAGIDSITCTRDHVFETTSGICMAKDLKGKRLMPFIDAKKPIASKYILAGYIQGDGNTSRLLSARHKGMEVYIGYKDSDVAKLFKIPSNEIKDDNRGTWYSQIAKETAKKYYLHSDNLSKRSLPDWMISIPSKTSYKDKADFLCGLFSANGCVINRTRIVFKTTCKRLSEELKTVLHDFGITSYITVNKPIEINWHNGEYTSKESYDVNIHQWQDIKKFAEQIGFIQKYKQEDLIETIKKRSPIITSVKYINDQKVYDFTEPETHWGVVNGFIAHNCAEHVAINGSACNLASMNLIKYLTPTGDFKEEQFLDDIYIIIMAQDIMIEPADYPTEKSRQIAIETRPLGLGFSNLGAYLMMKGFPYDSLEARTEAAYITESLTKAAYNMSIKLAQEIGPYKRYKENEERNLELIKKLTHNQELVKAASKHGIRNSQLTCLAPTGTISFLMDCDTTGIEPLFALRSTKTLAGGGTLKMTPGCVKTALSKLETVTVGSLDGKQEELEIRHLSPENQAIFKTANDIAPQDHILMMGACQKFLNGAISKTVNIPSSATVEDVEEAYMMAWDAGLKSIAIYRDGCKIMQPLVAQSDEIEEITEPNEEKWTAFRRKLPDTRHSITHKFDVGGLKGYLTCGMYEEGDLGEIFIRTQKEGTTVQGLMDGMATAVSLGLQYGVPVETFADKFIGSKFEPAGITKNEDILMAHSVSDYIFRWIKLNLMDDDEDEQLPDITKTNISFDGPPCPRCQTITGRCGTCYVCSQCGETTGCS